MIETIKPDNPEQASTEQSRIIEIAGQRVLTSKPGKRAKRPAKKPRERRI